MQEAELKEYYEAMIADVETELEHTRAENENLNNVSFI